MNAQKFIDELEKQAVLSDRLIEKLRQKLADSGGKMPAKSLARFLVQKKHLPGYLAQEILNEPFDLITGGLATDDDSSVENGGPSFGIESIVLSPIEDIEQRSAVKQGLTDDEDMDDPLVADVSLRQSPSSIIKKKPLRETEAKVREKVRRRERKQRSQKRSERQAKRKSEWDSPLLLFGGGAVILLTLVGATVWYMLFRDTGEDQLSVAQTAKNQGSYSQAISQYEKFLTDFPNHPEQSTARVELGMVRLRRATEGRADFRLALEVAEKEIKQIQNEEKFEDAHDELATLLPQIARGLGNQADGERDPATAGKLVQLATRALELSANPKLVPRNLRDSAELLEVRAVLQRVEQRRQSYTDLQNTIATMEKAIENGDTRTAYNAHRSHVKLHPEQAGETRLVEMVASTSASEKSGIQFIRDEKPAETAARPSPVVASLALAHHRGGPESTATGIVGVNIDGGLYGLDAATGHLAWRQFIGFDSNPYVLNVDDGLLVRDAVSHDLLMFNAADGTLRWRQPLGEAFAKPLVLGQMAYVASQSGKLYVIQLRSGSIAGHLQFAQPLPVPPAVDRSGQRLYLVGEHSSLYSISLSDLSCLGVYYLGHSTGSIRVAPACVLNKVAVFENLGVESSRFHLLAVDESGAVSESVHTARLKGLVSTPALVSGRRLVVMTDRGAIDVYDIGPQAGAGAINTVASRTPSSSRSVVSYALLADRNIWVADQQLTKFGVQPTDNRLPVRDIAKNYRGAVFDHPLQQIGNMLLHVRRPAGRAGAAVAAMDIDRGRTLWEIDLAIPPASDPMVDPADQTIVLATATGSLFALDRKSIRRRVQDKPIEPTGGPRTPPRISHGVDLGNGRSLFSDPAASPWLLLLDRTAGRRSSRWLELPSPLAAPPVAVGGSAIIPTKIGQVLLVDPSQEDAIKAAFQPRLQPRQVIPWLPPGSSDSLPGRCVLADGHETMYLLRLNESGAPELTAETEKQIGGLPLESQIAVQKHFASAVTSDRRLVVFSIPALEIEREVKLPGRVTWGPFPAGDDILLAVDTNQLASVAPASGQIRWQVPLGDASLSNVPLSNMELAGKPLVSKQSVVLAFRGGIVRTIDLATGETSGETDLGQPLASGVVPLGGRLIVAAHDGTLLVIEKP